MCGGGVVWSVVQGSTRPESGDAMHVRAAHSSAVKAGPADSTAKPLHLYRTGTTATPWGLVSLGSLKTTGDAFSATVPSPLMVRM
jgi:hypothetical protein